MSEVGVSQVWVVRLPTSQGEVVYVIWLEVLDEHKGKKVVAAGMKDMISSGRIGSIGKVSILLSSEAPSIYPSIPAADPSDRKAPR